MSPEQKKVTKEEYDEMPVVACSYCNSLNIREDDNSNDICMRCGAINEIKHFKTINHYLNETK